MGSKKLRVVLIKPSKYGINGFVERFRWGFMPNSTLPHLYSLTTQLAETEGLNIETHAVDEYVQNNLDYLRLLEPDGQPTLVALVGVQSHQFQRALDIAALARSKGAMAIIGGPHPMTCRTDQLQGQGISFALAEAELIWETILHDALEGALSPVYGTGQRWERELSSPVIVPPSPEDLKRYVMPMVGIYPARGCPFRCNFCSVIKIAGRNVRSQSVETTLGSLVAAQRAGVRYVMFTSDNFNKIPSVRELLDAMIEEKINLPFFAQCDTQIEKDEALIERMARAGCFQMFIGVESFSRKALLAAKKFQNHPQRYQNIGDLCHKHGVSTHFSNIIGFPQDTEDDVKEHVRIIRQLSPNMVSWYILTPIPGTEQYDEFLSQGLITEPNLDRFDGSCTTWQHPHFSQERLRALLFECYQKFYSLPRTIRTAARSQLSKLDLNGFLGSMLNLGFVRWNTWRHFHPMAGGVRQIRVDHIRDYLSLRRSLFGFDLAPLPESLALAPIDEEFNRQVKLVGIG